MVIASTLTAGAMPREREPAQAAGRHPFDQESTGGEGLTGPTPFMALLDTTRAKVGERISAGAVEGGSPSQMFEPDPSDAREHRQAVLSERDQADRIRPADDDPFDRTSVQARRLAGKSDDSATAPSSGSDGVNSTRSSAFVEGSPRGEEPSTSRFSLDGETADARATRIQQGRLPRTTENGPARNVGIANAVEADGRSGPAQPASSAAGAVASPTVSSGYSRSSDLAHQVGQLLNAARIGEVESARAPASSPATANAPRSTPDPRTPQPTRSTAQARPRPLTKEATQTEAAARSPFERLVRSIRFRNGDQESSARLRLDPPELGRLRVDVRLVGDQLEVDVRTETREATERLYQRAAQLRTALASHGIHIERFDVTMGAVGYESAGTDQRDDSDSADDAPRTPFPLRAGSGSGGEAGDGSEAIDASTISDVGPEPATVAERRLDVRV